VAGAPLRPGLIQVHSDSTSPSFQVRGSLSQIVTAQICRFRIRVPHSPITMPVLTSSDSEWSGNSDDEVRARAREHRAKTSAKKSAQSARGKKPKAGSSRPRKRSIPDDSDSEEELNGAASRRQGKRSRPSPADEESDVQRAIAASLSGTMETRTGGTRSKETRAAGAGKKATTAADDDDESWRAGECWMCKVSHLNLQGHWQNPKTSCHAPPPGTARRPLSRVGVKDLGQKTPAPVKERSAPQQQARDKPDQNVAARHQGAPTSDRNGSARVTAPIAAAPAPKPAAPQPAAAAEPGLPLSADELRQQQQELRRIELEQKEKQQQQIAAAGAVFSQQRGGLPARTSSEAAAAAGANQTLPGRPQTSANAGTRRYSTTSAATSQPWSGSATRVDRGRVATQDVPSSFVTINVKTKIGNNSVCCVQCKLTDSVSRVKGLIHAEVEVSVNQLRLLSGNRHLIDTRSLRECQIEDNASLSILPDSAGIFVKTIEVECLLSVHEAAHACMMTVRRGHENLSSYALSLLSAERTRP